MERVWIASTATFDRAFFLFYTDHERLHIHFKLAPSDNYSQIIAGYMRKDAATVVNMAGEVAGRHAMAMRADMGH